MNDNPIITSNSYINNHWKSPHENLFFIRESKITNFEKSFASISYYIQYKVKS